ncbi:MAG: hypothetical protein BAJALOKI2v1_10004 [Promethearchaeota archaeon]|nr:MAG: hypothetical protein BAJALOKI2v1_10004 [Candidatus Lokiarchaeota archaeon]
MENIEKYSEKIFETKDHQEINDILLQLAQNPNQTCLEIVDQITQNFSEELLDKVNLNLVYLIGEIAKKYHLPEICIEYVIQAYDKSDRWVRNEIIKTLSKISGNQRIMNKIIDILIRALNDNYTKIKLSSLNLLLEETILPKSLLEHILRNINASNKDVVEKALEVLKHFYISKEDLFIALNYSDHYQILKKEGIRNLLVEYFSSVMNLENFRMKIAESDWDAHAKRLFLNEIDSYLKILLK